MNPPHSHELMLAIITGTIVFFLLVAFCISYIMIYRERKRKHEKELMAFREAFHRQLLQSQVEVQEYTYSALSKELHDNIGQLLSTARMLLGLTERDVANPPDTLLTANATLAQAINELRSLSKSLDNDWLRQFSFHDNMQTEMMRINKAGNVITADLNVLNALALTSDRQLILFRIVQEGIQNALKHAKPDNITIAARQNGEAVLLTIADDGCGFVPGLSRGMGTVNMKHRCELLGGSITWDAATPRGTLITIILPLKHPLS